MNTYFICLYSGSTSEYLSRKQGEEIQAMIAEKGVEATRDYYAGTTFDTVYVNDGMGESIITDDKIMDIWSVEGGDEDVVDNELLELCKDEYQHCHIQEYNEYDLIDMEWQEVDNTLLDEVKVGKEAMEGFLKNIIYNDDYGLRTKCQKHIKQKIEEHIKENKRVLTERQMEHLDNRGWHSTVSLTTWAGEGRYDYEEHKD